MAGNIKNTILTYELIPPQGSWENIVQRLDKEFDKSEIRVGEFVAEMSITPPANAWEQISSGIETSRIRKIDPSIDQPAKVVPLMKRKWMSAAVTTGLVLLAALFYLLQPRKDDRLSSNTNTSAKSEEIAGVHTESIGADAIGQLAGLIPQLVSPQEENPGIEDSGNLDTVISTETSIPAEPEIEVVSTRDIQSVKQTQEVKVTAPPIRDEAGNIILNMDLLTSQSSNYISVTGPNGEQTKVSVKFAQYLAFMNEATTEEDDYIDFLFRQSGLWRQKFTEWKTKLADQTAFAPSSACFFDILELKDLIKD